MTDPHDVDAVRAPTSAPETESGGSQPGRPGTATLARALVSQLIAQRPIATDLGPRLVGEAGPVAGSHYQLTQGPAAARGVWSLGRDPSCDIAIRDPDLSREHARLSRVHDQWTLTDLGSKNGTFLDGEPLPAHEPRPVRHGAQLELGACALRLDDRVSAYRSALEPTASAVPRPESSPLASQPARPPLTKPTAPWTTWLRQAVALAIAIAAGLALLALLLS